MEVMELPYCSQVSLFFLFWIQSVQQRVNDLNTVRKVVKLRSNECLIIFTAEL